MTTELREPVPPPPPPPPPPAPVPAGWEGILDTGEAILWQGAPDGRIRFQLRQIPAALFGLLFSGFALFWMVMAAQAGGFFWMFGLIHFVAGLAVMGGDPLGGAYRRRHTHYTLTSRRAFIASRLPWRGRQLQSYPITGTTPLTFEEETDGLSTIYFATADRLNRNGRAPKHIGFELIPEGRRILSLMRGLQRGEGA